MDKERVCFNCAFCTECYPSFKDVCDVDDHEIKDVYSESCKKFVEVNESED